jgi:hypothetical protein
LSAFSSPQSNKPSSSGVLRDAREGSEHECRAFAHRLTSKGEAEMQHRSSRGPQGASAVYRRVQAPACSRERSFEAAKPTYLHIGRTPELLVALSVFVGLDAPGRQRALATAEMLGLSGCNAAKDGVAIMREIVGAIDAANAVGTGA